MPSEASRPQLLRAITALEAVLLLAGLGAMLLLALRAAIRLDPGYDAWLYHIPFAARHGRLGIPFDSAPLEEVWRGFPPLPEFAQGLLWRLSDSVHAVGTVNWLALAGFLLVCHRKLGAPFFLVGPIALTAPLVLIHATTAYVDLFANAFLAVGVSVLVRAYLFESWADPRLLAIGLGGLVGAAWSKFQLTPLVAVFLAAYATLCWRRTAQDRRGRRLSAGLVGSAALVAALPYLKNLVLYHNPFWPVEVPLAGSLFPFSGYAAGDGAVSARPPLLIGEPQFKVFLHSILEIGHPTWYPNRPRWTLDQGSGWIAFRSGGFWNIAVIANLALTGTLLPWLKGGKGARVVLGGLALLFLVGWLPQSNELRYYMFIPLCWAGLLGMLYPALKAKRPSLCIPLALLVGGLFITASRINRDYYRSEPISHATLAGRWHADTVWPHLKSGVTYCAVGWEPAAILLTGPSLYEFRIAERRDPALCPRGSVLIPGGVRP